MEGVQANTYMQAETGYRTWALPDTCGGCAHRSWQRLVPMDSMEKQPLPGTAKMGYM